MLHIGHPGASILTHATDRRISWRMFLPEYRFSLFGIMRFLIVYQHDG
jgi:hypothetical protein